MLQNIKNITLSNITAVVIILCNNIALAAKDVADQDSKKIIELRHPIELIDSQFSFFDHYWNNIFNERLYALGADSIRSRIITKDEKYIITMEVPGYDRKQIKIKVKGSKLLISGNTNSEDSKKNNPNDSVNQHKQFDYAISLNDDVDQKAITSDLKNGILTIILPRIKIKDENAIEIRIN
jgi:HSP20 family molecular chaperone IbpA